MTQGSRPVAERELALTNSAGLHLRPAKGFVELALRFHADVVVIKDEEQSDGRSVLSLLGLNAAQGSRLLVRCTGEDAHAACEELAEYLNKLPELHGETSRGAREGSGQFPEAVWP